MASPNIYAIRRWMYNRVDEATGEISEDFKAGLRNFMEFATNQDIAHEGGKIICPCCKCMNEKFIHVEIVWKHLFLRGFTPGYYIWLSHGEELRTMPGTSVDYTHDVVEGGTYVGNDSQGFGLNRENDRVVEMITDALPDTMRTTTAEEEPNAEAKRFYDMLQAASIPIYAGCKEGQSALSAATRLLSIKTEWNLSEDCVDAIADFAKDFMPADNVAPGSYYAIQKLVSGLGLPYEMIDVCRDNCMIFWGDDVSLESCKFCGKERFQDQGTKTKIPYQRMWYLPVADRLKRLYQSHRTAAAMRWHAEHDFVGDICHPSDGEAWKNFNSKFPGFATEARNVYLGLCTDGFNPFGKSGRKYSLWPVILTLYNLPPALCMKKEFLFLTILVHGPDHPRRSLDVFLQPLIEELKKLWFDGIIAYDISTKTNFTMHDVLMWTISDFPAFEMLSGWTTHGRLSCPYCQDNTDSFQLKHGRKQCWFDCHRRFLKDSHAFRRNRRLFRANKVVNEDPPFLHTGGELLQQLKDFDVDPTVLCGGNGHEKVDGYGEFHNWHKKVSFRNYLTEKSSFGNYLTVPSLHMRMQWIVSRKTFTRCRCYQVNKIRTGMEINE